MASRRSLSKSPLDKLAKLNSVSTIDGKPSVNEAAGETAVALICNSVSDVGALVDSLLLPMMLSMLNVVLLEPLLRPGAEDELGDVGVVGLAGVDSGES